MAILVGMGVAQQPVRLLARLDEGKWVAFVDPTSGVSRRVYSIHQPAASNLTVAPNDGHVALLETGGSEREPYRNELVVLDAGGNPVHRITRDIQRYVWCGPTCLAYIEGTFREGGIGFIPRGAFVFDISTGQEELLPGPTYAYDLRWAPFDSSLYLKNAGREDGFGIYRYHLVTGALSRTRHRDFDFSPSGAYYIQWAGEASDRARMFDRETDREVAWPDSTKVGVPSRWAFEHGDYLIMVRRERQDSTARRPPRVVDRVVFDVRSRRVVQRLDGEIPPWSAAPGVLPVVRRGRITLMSRLEP